MKPSLSQSCHSGTCSDISLVDAMPPLLIAVANSVQTLLPHSAPLLASLMKCTKSLSAGSQLSNIAQCYWSAGCTGLLVDIDRIREDNERRTDVERKAGLIIWSGRKLAVPWPIIVCALPCLVSSGYIAYTHLATPGVEL